MLLALLLALLAPAASDGETLLLQDPSASDTHVVFVYAADLWIVERRGGTARRLTSDAGMETHPRFSPDGKWVAYSAQYDGNTDVYVIPSEGGSPQRLTWHPGRDTVQGWHPSSDLVLFSSSRDTGTGVTRLFQVSRSEPTTPEALVIPRANHASYSANAKFIAYTPIRDAFRTWKRYRGGRVSRVWIFDMKSYDHEEIPHVDANDTFPAFLGGDVYFASDRDRHMNLYRYRPGSGNAPEQLTQYTDFDVRHLSAGGGVIAFEQGGAIHLYHPDDNRVERLSIRVVHDGLAGRPRWQPVKGFVRSARIAPNGKRAVFEARGEIITVPRKHGDARNLTQSTDAHDRSPIWSPDGEKIAWLSDRTDDGNIEAAEYRLWVRDRLGRDEPRAYDLGDGGFYYDPQWSPDGEHVLLRDKRNRLAYVTLDTGNVKTVAVAEGSLGVVWTAAAWARDSQWIAYEARNSRTLYDRIALYELATGNTTVITDDFADASDPAFSRDGRHLFFAASVESGPTQFGLDMETSTARPPRSNLYAVVLQADGDHPFEPRSDEATDDEWDDDDSENGDDEGDDEKNGDRRRGKRDGDSKDKPIPPLDVDGIDQRIVAVPLPSGRYWNLQCARDRLLFLSRGNDATDLVAYDLEDREKKTLAAKVDDYDVAANGRALLVASAGSWEIRSLRKSDDNHRLAVDDVKVRVDPAAEWPQTLREAWRIERDYFYDPGMHGTDWPAMWKRYSAFLPHVRHRADLDVLLQEMLGELACGHNYVRSGEMPDREEGVATGLLGADFAPAGNLYQLQTILRGQNWNPNLRAPLTEPGVDAKVGDYLIAVNGRPITTTDNLFSAFANTAGKQTDITLSSRPDGSEPRTSTVVPIANERSLRRLSWVEDNRRLVDELSDGRLAYIYMPNTGSSGLAAFDRDYYSQLDKQGLILDERFNGGGKVADYVIHVLSRRPLSYWMNREQWVGRSPFGMMPGPKVMLINERAGSGGDWMPWAFQNSKLGVLVGTRTWGGLVGISGYPALMDGGGVTAASFGVMDTKGNWAVENVGVSPDVEVIQTPRKVIAGRDPQLERAIKIAIQALEMSKPLREPKYKPPTPR